MNYTTSDRSAVSPDGRVVLPLDHPEVLQFIDGGGVIGEDGMLDLTLRPNDELQEQIDLIRWVVSGDELDAALERALASDNANGDVFSGDDDISEKQALEAALAQKDEELAFANERIAELESREPEVRIVERVVEVSSPEAAPLKIIPDEIAAMMDPGDTFSPEVRRKLTERLNVELAELKNLRGLAGEDLKREAEIEKLLGLFARLGEI